MDVGEEGLWSAGLPWCPGPSEWMGERVEELEGKGEDGGRLCVGFFFCSCTGWLLGCEKLLFRCSLTSLCIAGLVSWSAMPSVFARRLPVGTELKADCVSEPCCPSVLRRAVGAEPSRCLGPSGEWVGVLGAAMEEGDDRERGLTGMPPSAAMEERGEKTCGGDVGCPGGVRAVEFGTRRGVGELAVCAVG